MSYNPNLSFFINRLQGVSKNILKLESHNADEATSNKIISFSLPSASLLDLQSLKFHFNADADAGASDTGGRLPNGIDKLFQKIEISAGGIWIQGEHCARGGLRREPHLKAAFWVQNTDAHS